VVPARKEVAQSASFLQSGKAPTRSNIFLQAMEIGVPSPYPADWPAQGQRLNTAMDAYLNTPATSLPNAMHQAGMAIQDPQLTIGGD
jgi:hypothetical protein